MGSSPFTDAAADCADCGLVPRPASQTAAVLARLAPSLWNQTPPSEEATPELLAGDLVDDATIFGPAGSNDVTPQWEIARNFRLAKDRFLAAWRQTEADQLALGHASINGAGQMIGEGTYARGADLDRWVEQFGVGRPDGFTDCCLSRLFTLLLFQFGNTRWLLQEIAQLYTGIRPQAVESRSRIMLVWPLSVLVTFWSDPAAPSRPAFDGYYTNASGSGGLWSGETPSIGYDLDSFFFDGAAPWFDSSTPVQTMSAWSTPPTNRITGLTLENALAVVAPAGVHVELNNKPQWGVSGCAGAVYRGMTTRRGRWG